MITSQIAPLQFRQILLAGLASGLIMNIGEAALHGSVLAEATKSAYTALNRSVSPDPVNLISLVLLTFVQAIVMVWLYTLLRPHLGSRVGTAACVGLAGWLLSSVYAAVYLSSGFPGILPANLAWVPVAWQLVEYPLAVMVGASAYGK